MDSKTKGLFAAAGLDGTGLERRKATKASATTVDAPPGSKMEQRKDVLLGPSGSQHLATTKRVEVSMRLEFRDRLCGHFLPLLPTVFDLLE